MRIVMDRSVTVVLALLGAFSLSVAVADTPAEPAATSPAAATPGSDATTTSAPAAAATPTAAAAPTAAKPATVAESDAALEKRLTNSGYKPRTRNGTKVWCKREGELGSRLGGQEVCGTPDEMRLQVQQQQDAVKSVQKLFNATLK